MTPKFFFVSLSIILIGVLLIMRCQFKDSVSYKKRCDELGGEILTGYKSELCVKKGTILK